MGALKTGRIVYRDILKLLKSRFSACTVRTCVTIHKDACCPNQPDKHDVREFLDWKSAKEFFEDAVINNGYKDIRIDIFQQYRNGKCDNNCNEEIDEKTAPYS